MKFSEVYNKNFFEKSCLIPGIKQFYFVDFLVNKESRASIIFRQKRLKSLWKIRIPYNKDFTLVGIWIKASDYYLFEKCMAELENTAPLFCLDYKKARIEILDDIVVLKSESSS